MTDETTPPIIVNSSAIPGNLESAARAIITAIGGWAIGRGYLDAGTAAAIGTILAVVGPLAWGQISTWRNHQKLVTAATFAPNDIAQVKR